MTVFADASALIALIAKEADALDLAARLQADRDRLFSALSAWETSAGLCRSYGLAPDIAAGRVRLLLQALDFRIVVIGAAELDAASGAYARFGKGRHPASLNMGDCFAYACAKANGATLLFKGDDFAKTDIVRAPR